MNGNGVINAQDVTLTRNRQFSELPADEPSVPFALRSAKLGEEPARKWLVDGLV